MTVYTCPNGCDLRGEPIDPKHFDPALHDVDPKRHADSLAKHGRCFCLPYGEKAPEDRYYSRVFGVYDQAQDRTIEWACPDCGARWDR